MATYMFNANARFLIVDDSSIARNEIRSVLNKLGFSFIDETSDGRTAIEKIKSAAKSENSYWVVFLDLNMPEMDGLKTLDTIRQTSTIEHTRVVVITTDSSKPTVISAVMKGISGYIVKPFSADDVRKELLKIFNRIEAEL